MTITRQRFSEIHASLSMNEYMDMLETAREYAYNAEKDLDDMNSAQLDNILEYVEEADSAYGEMTSKPDRESKQISRLIGTVREAHTLVDQAHDLVANIHKELKQLTR